ncbi:hypothetical protein BHE74_00047937 [Ensete ventricosum]|nr:hypothetical protein BHE74_00047937 [Ensete ventricosum]
MPKLVSGALEKIFETEVRLLVLARRSTFIPVVIIGMTRESHVAREIDMTRTGDWVESTCLGVLLVPISNEEGDVTMGAPRRAPISNEEGEASVATTRGSPEVDGGEAEEAIDLVLHLELVSPVPTLLDGEVCAKHHRQLRLRRRRCWCHPHGPPSRI